MDGYIDEFAIFNKALNETEIANLYNNGNGLQYPFNTDVPTSTCDCASIQAGTTIDCSEGCDISSCDANGENINIIGTGSISISGDITNYGDVLIQGTDVSNKCEVTCQGGCFSEWLKKYFS